MKIKPEFIPQSSEFDFVQSVTRFFRAPMDRDFIRRLFIVAFVGYSIISLMTIGFTLKFFETMATLNWDTIQLTKNSSGGEQLDDVIKMLSSFALIIPLVIVGSVFWVSVNTAFHQKVFHNIDYGKFPLRFGQNEWRMFTSYLAVFGLYILSLITMFILGVLFIVIFSIEGTAPKIIAAILLLLLIVGSFFGGGYICLRFTSFIAWRSLEPNGTMFGGVTLSKSRVRYIFLSILALVICAFIFQTIYNQILFGFMIGESQQTLMSGLGEQSPAIVFDAFYDKLKNPLFLLASIATLLFSSAVSVLYMLSLSGLGVYVVEWWQQDKIAHDQVRIEEEL